ncbi:MFS transporter [Halalkalicoccus subterraneus]|uniref:MFS transporter n=1 Tax=Halalkalicoccus subterraneus TaxID=2675002 RepID=UPI000EFAA012|nr:MFS transporter [Halalkalicoccus subterraneus]
MNDSPSTPAFGSVAFDGGRGRMLAVLSVGVAALLAGQLVIAPALPAIIAEFEIAPSQAGVGLTVMWACGALAMFPGGRSSDLLSRKTVLVASVAVLVVGFLVAASAPTFLAFLGGLAVAGIGVGLYEPANMALVFESFGDRRGRALGVIAASYSFGSALAGGFATLAVALASWRLAFLPVLVGLACVGAGVHRWSREPYVLSRASLDPRPTVGRLFDSPSIRRLLGLFCLYMFVWQAAIGFLPTFLRLEKGLSPALANGAFVAVFLIGLVISPTIGDLGDRFGHRRVGGSAPLVGALGLSVLVVASGPLVGLGIVLFAVGLMSFWPVMNAYLMARLAPDSLGGDYGLSRGVFFGAGSLGPVYTGLVAQYASYGTAYAGLICCFLASAILVRTVE